MNEALDKVRAYGETRAEFWAAPPRGTCPECDEADVILHERDEGLPPVCAHCYRRTSVRAREQACDRCGEGPATRDPASRVNEYYCARCHRANGLVPGERAMVNVLRVRQTQAHPEGRREPCVAGGYGTDCAGQVKPRGAHGGRVLCDLHARGGRA